MESGMLWYDNSKKPLREVVVHAVEYYANKYGQKPTHCMVNPCMLKGSSGRVAGVLVCKEDRIMPNHFWIGVDDSTRKERIV